MTQVKIRMRTPGEEIKVKKSYGIREAFLRFFDDLKVFGDQPCLFVLPHLVTTLLFRGTWKGKLTGLNVLLESNKPDMQNG